MAFISFLEGFVIGFLLAMPVGPIGILCVRRTLTNGKHHGIIVGISGASADIVYALVAAFGVTLISDFVTGFQYWIRLAGGVLLLILGFYIFRSQPALRNESNRSNIHAKTYFSTFLLALTNPMTLFAFATAFSAVRSGQIMNDRIILPMLVAGVFFGSFFWFFMLANFAFIFKKNLTNGRLILVNKISGCLLMCFGVIALWAGANKL
jgi:threonine/homoserine/homoserine lactone efflux protein